MTLPAIPLAARRVFVDSGAYLALLDADDEHHDEASSILAYLANNHYRQLTTNAVLFEAHALITSRLGIDRGLRFLTEMRSGNTVVVRVSAPDEAHAKEILFRYRDKDFSFTDALSFAVMERLHITAAFAFDRHFRQYGFTVLQTT